MARDEETIPPTPQRLAKGDLEVVTTARGGTETRSFAYPLNYHLRKALITRRQYNAGIRLAQLWEASGGTSHHAQMRYEEPTGGTGFAEYVYFLGPDLKAALDSIAGQPERDKAIAVCCHGEAAGEGKGMRQLIGALNDLAEHFRRLNDLRPTSA